jgi:adenylate kinase
MPKKTAGTRLVEAIKAEMEQLNCIPTSVEEQLLSIAASMADRIERLEKIVADQGELISTPTGQVKTNPAVVEIRSQSVALTRVLSAISITDSTGQKRPPKDPQRQAAANRRWNLETGRS